MITIDFSPAWVYFIISATALMILLKIRKNNKKENDIGNAEFIKYLKISKTKK